MKLVEDNNEDTEDNNEGNEDTEGNKEDNEDNKEDKDGNKGNEGNNDDKKHIDNISEVSKYYESYEEYYDGEGHQSGYDGDQSESESESESDCEGESDSYINLEFSIESELYEPGINKCYIENMDIIDKYDDAYVIDELSEFEIIDEYNCIINNRYRKQTWFAYFRKLYVVSIILIASIIFYVYYTYKNNYVLKKTTMRH